MQSLLKGICCIFFSFKGGVSSIGAPPFQRRATALYKSCQAGRRVRLVNEGSMAKSWARAFYRSQAWRAIRRRALIRDGFTCRICGARATEVDHIKELTPDNIKDPKVSLSLDNLQSLCHECHTVKTMEDKGVISLDCDIEYYFDQDGNIVPRTPQK